MPDGSLTLYGYWRSSAAWRVRLALAAKGLAYDSVPIDLRHDVQSGADYLARNPQGLVPALDIGSAVLGQSLAIIEFLDETHPEPPLLPGDAIGRARVRAAALMVAADIHPLGNLRVQRYLKSPLGVEQAVVDDWTRHWVGLGLAALEHFAQRHAGEFMYGDRFSLADICLVPQLYNARRVMAPLDSYPLLLRAESAVQGLSFAAAAAPDMQTDALKA
ncbi:maleylacetoacetate isomerase [Sandarakinorhabdus sp.]|uniref:maleylacetoacetate isomerase n=1 Tax=Sandarakinorhabdus sp. TaxID=1916663 RepID=UPI00286DE664|nr:maleylacetoacetate isomerase [Sandarakinorhabdus sp.]